MNTLDEKVLALFERKRQNLIEDYGLHDKPVLTVQCEAPSSGQINVEKQQVVRALGEGARNLSEDGWWHGFVSHLGVVRVFDGISTSKPSGGSKYTAELHDDGHFIAAVWEFPIRDDSMVLADFYGYVFRDALFSAQQVMEAAGIQGDVMRTAALEKSDKIGFIRGHYVEMTGHARKVLQWPVEVLSLGDLAASWARPAARLLRAYHQTLPPDIKLELENSFNRA